MATTKVLVTNGRFVEYQGRYFDYLDTDANTFSGNGWEGYNDNQGNLVIEAARCYSNGWNIIRMTVYKDGRYRITEKHGDDDQVKVIKRGRFASSLDQISGQFGLAGGAIWERYIYFRNSEFQNFLNKYGITSVKRENPNQEFTLRRANYGGGECKSAISTNGSTTEVDFDLGKSEVWAENNPGTCAYESNTTIQVVGATWAIVEQSQHEGMRCNCFKILYTLENPLELELPKI